MNRRTERKEYAFGGRGRGARKTNPIYFMTVEGFYPGIKDKYHFNNTKGVSTNAVEVLRILSNISMQNKAAKSDL